MESVVSALHRTAPHCTLHSTLCLDPCTLGGTPAGKNTHWTVPSVCALRPAVYSTLRSTLHPPRPLSTPGKHTAPLYNPLYKTQHSTKHTQNSADANAKRRRRRKQRPAVCGDAVPRRVCSTLYKALSLSLLYSALLHSTTLSTLHSPLPTLECVFPF